MRVVRSQNTQHLPPYNSKLRSTHTFQSSRSVCLDLSWPAPQVQTLDKGSAHVCQQSAKQRVLSATRRFQDYEKSVGPSTTSNEFSLRASSTTDYSSATEPCRLQVNRAVDSGILAPSWRLWLRYVPGETGLLSCPCYVVLRRMRDARPGFLDSPPPSGLL